MRATGVLLTAVLVLGSEVHAIEKLTYDVVEKIDRMEIRAYPVHVLARVHVDAGFEDAGNRGFRMLFGYIDGANDAGRNIAMTAPVLQVPEEDGYEVAFVMPSEFDAASLPHPEGDRVTLTTEPAVLMAALRYSGNWSRQRYLENEQALRDALAASAYRACGAPTWARYDPPFMPTFLRRNEVLIPVCRQADTQPAVSGR
jgi:hypothetical protein